jgi:hypothetical protein
MQEMQKKGLDYKFPVKKNERDWVFDFLGQNVLRPSGSTNCTTVIQECAGAVYRDSGVRATKTDLDIWRGAKGYETGGGPAEVLVRRNLGTKVNSIQDIIPGDVIQRRERDGSGHAFLVFDVYRDANGKVTGFMSIEATSRGGTDRNAIQHVQRTVADEKVFANGRQQAGVFHIARPQEP